MPRISIIMPAYNAGDYIAETLDSIANQTFEDFECLIINDGSTDNTLDVASEYAHRDGRFKVISLENSGGPAKPRNLGLAAACGEYICMFDSDDLMQKEKLAVSVNALDNHPNINFLFSNFSSIDERGNIIKNNFLADYDLLWEMLSGGEAAGQINCIDAASLYKGVCTINFIGTSSVVLRRSALTEKDIFDERLKNSDDRLFWMRFTKHNSGIFINEQLHQYRIQSGSISNQGFLRRGPSKIQALEMALAECDKRDVKIELKRQIAKDYLTLAYASKLQNNHAEQSVYAMKSLKMKLSFFGFRSLFQAAIFRLVK